MKDYDRRQDVSGSDRTVNGAIYPMTVQDGQNLRILRQVTNGDFVTPNPFSFVLTKSRCLRGTITAPVGVNGWKEHTGAISATRFNSPVDTLNGPNVSTMYTTPYNEAVASLSDKVRGDLDLTIDGFQIKQLASTIERLKRPVETFVDSWKRIAKRSGTLDRSARTINELGALYLEFWYGIRPTVLSAQELAAKIEAEIKGSRLLARVRTRGHLKHSMTVKIYDGANTCWGYQHNDFSVKTDTSVRCQIDVELSQSFSTLQKIAQYISLDPVAWAYELCPYSFVLDWVWNFGGYLRTLETALIYSSIFKQGTVTYSAKKVSKVVSFTSATNGFVVREFSGGESVSCYYDRVVLTSYPFPRLPKFNVSMGSWRLAALAALLSQGVGRKLPLRLRSHRNYRNPTFDWSEVPSW